MGAPTFGVEVNGRLEKVLIEIEEPGREIDLRVKNDKFSFIRIEDAIKKPKKCMRWRWGWGRRARKWG